MAVTANEWVGSESTTQSGASQRAIIWGLFQIVALGGLALIGWLALAPPVPVFWLGAGFAAAALPQLMTTALLIREGARAPGLALWTTALVLFALCLVLVQAPRFGAHDPTIVHSALAFFALAAPYLALSFKVREGKDMSPRWRSGAVSAIAASQTLALAAMCASLRFIAGLEIETSALIAFYTIIIAQPVAACWLEARSEHKLPIKPGGEPKHEHISGLGVISLVVFVMTIVGLGLWAASRANSAYISQGAGVIVIAGLAIAFALVALGPNVRAGDQLVRALAEAKVISRLGNFVSRIDGVLVFAFAGAMGASQERGALRYGLLVGHLIPSAILGWFLPAPWGLVPLAWAFIGAMAVARRWAWVEEDRENAMLNRKFEGPHIKVGFAQDLRDEALLGFMSLFLLVPLALRQMHIAFGGNLFVINTGASADDLIAWMSFFGTELAKAVPFVDWAEIYQVKGDAPIHINDASVGPAQHVVFATRVIVDLVFLAALLQAISISQRAAKLKDMFYKDRTLNRLDPFTEAKAFKALVDGEKGYWVLREPIPEPFLAYDEDRLEELQIKHENDVVGFAASELLRRNALRSPELLLVEEAKLAKPDADKLEDYIERIRAKREDLIIHDLKAAHYLLNEARTLRAVREEIVEIIGENWRNDGAVSALSDILLAGVGARDARQEVRLAALKGLYAAAVHGDREARIAIVWAADNEAQKLKEQANTWLKEHPDWRGSRA